MSVSAAVFQLFDLIMLVMIIKVLLSWVPNINWYNQPFKLINDIAEPIFAPFRKIVPPVSGIDISPIIAFIVLGLLQQLFVRLLVYFGM